MVGILGLGLVQCDCARPIRCVVHKPGRPGKSEALPTVMLNEAFNPDTLQAALKPAPFVLAGSFWFLLAGGG